MPRIAVALSGGGYRAAALSAGALLYLIDSGRAGEITAVSSVSGGSITNAFFARNVLSRGSSPDHWTTSGFLLAFLARRDILSPGRMLAIPVILAVPTAIVTGWAARGQGTAYALAVAVPLGIVMVITGLLVLFLQLRRSLEHAVEWLLMLPDANAVRRASPRLTPLTDLDIPYNPIFCCTDLATGSQFSVAPSFVAGLVPSYERPASSSVTLTGTAEGLPIATAVAASAAFPLVFRPTVVSSDALGLPVRRGIIEDEIVLADGGLYDNLGISVLDAWASGDMPAQILDELGDPPEATIVVDSGQASYQRQRGSGLVRRVIRSMDIIHQANSLSRRREIQRQFHSGERPGVLVSIDDDPYVIAQDCPDEATAASVTIWLKEFSARQGMTRPTWAAAAQQTHPAIPTNLSHLGVRKVSRLVLHGYAVTMARTTTQLGWVPAPPDRIPSDLPGLCTDPFVGTILDRVYWVLIGRKPRHRGATSLVKEAIER